MELPGEPDLPATGFQPWDMVSGPDFQDHEDKSVSSTLSVGGQHPACQVRPLADTDRRGARPLKEHRWSSKKRSMFHSQYFARVSRHHGCHFFFTLSFFFN